MTMMNMRYYVVAEGETFIFRGCKTEKEFIDILDNRFGKDNYRITVTDWDYDEPIEDVEVYHITDNRVEITVANGYAVISQDDMEEDELVLDIVEATAKRRGTGTRLVELAKKWAEKHSKVLTLCCYPQDDSIEYTDLIEFYSRLGFDTEYQDDEYALMRYEA